MSDITRILSAIELGDKQAIHDLLPLVYDALRQTAAREVAGRVPGETLQATALVHEAYFRLFGRDGVHWNSRRHFYAAAALAMRGILIDSARKRNAQKRGGHFARLDLDEAKIEGPEPDFDVIEIDHSLKRLSEQDPISAELVHLRFFAGLSNEEAAKTLEITSRKAQLLWKFARAWLRRDLDSGTLEKNMA